MSTLITGGSGLLGQKLQHLYSDAICPTHFEMDIDRPIKFDGQIDMVIHCAALKNGPCDTDRLAGMRTNIMGTAHVADLCCQKNAKLVYISTDYVFRGDRGNYAPTDEVGPSNYYGETKLAGEYAAKCVPQHLIVRLSFYTDVFPYPAAFVDQYTTRVTVTEAAEKIYDLIQKDCTGVYHICGKKRSVYDYAVSTNGGNEINPISLADDSLVRPVDASLVDGT